MIENLFLCVGAQKSGTTWLYSQLENHPDVGFSDVKEVHYFNTIHNGSVLLTRRKVEHIERFIKNNRPALEKYFSNLSQGKQVDAGIKRLLSPVDDQWYIDLFSKNKKKYSADFSPEYALLPKAGFENIKRISKKQKIIFMMRDPISRAKSAIQYYFQTHNFNYESIDNRTIETVMKKDFITDLSKYEKTIENLNNSFREEDILYLFFEEVMSDKQRGADDVYKFLDIEKIDLVKEKSEEVVNKSRKISMPSSVDDYLNDALHDTYRRSKELLGRLPESWSEKNVK